ncbi:DNA internalization-related competence protein ComEC/Rec2 [Thioalkalivibrio sp. HK1]|uniref:DNA internalization-related competence protein ComEC/Rec2 n=1 Tax=Thioalkalivibrio sp. HK1 TaxID=1469245 RepID=UPI00046FD560|nr:DNA internalization-related competence protein ComEC/Rec2 [Thioalkalivibrio sp. HK1]
MLRFALFFALGVAWLETDRSLPDPMWCAFLPMVVWAAFSQARAHIGWAALAGFLWAALLAHLQLASALPEALDGQSIEVIGTVRGLPQADPMKVRFDIDVRAVEVERPGWSASLPEGRIRLWWYRTQEMPQPGTIWRLNVRLRAPKGWRNPGAFDYEGWLFTNRIIATGQVHFGEPVGESALFSLAKVDALRAEISRRLRESLAPWQSEGLVRALAIGDRSGISEYQWEVLRTTGTAHLMAISGLHIGMAAASVYWVVVRIWRLVPWLMLRIAASQAAAMAAMIAASAYALLAGFSLPTRRALIMLAVVFGSQILRRRLLPSHGLALALSAILILDPHSVVMPGFWLSFVAVAAILAIIATQGEAGHSKPSPDAVGDPSLPLRIRSRGRAFVEISMRWLRSLGRVQIAVTLGLVPISLAVFSEQSLVSPVVNALAIPLVGVAVVPLILAALVIFFLFPAVANGLLGPAATILDALWPLLARISSSVGTLPAPGGIEPWQLILAAVGVLTLLAPRGLLPRWTGICWLLPLLMARPDAIRQGEWRLTMLDVGHGLSVVVETARHVLVYDTGSGRPDATARALVPYLRWRGHRAVDRVVLSHGDSDHVGGYPTLERKVRVSELMANAPPPRSMTPTPASMPDIRSSTARLPDRPCLAGDRWEWDGVSFEILHPIHFVAGTKGKARNNQSCVIRIEGGGSALLTGDIESESEYALIRRGRRKLEADILIVPHHGSKSSSTPAFIDAVSPSIALFSTAVRGRFSLPHTEVLDRYAKRSIASMTTPRCGAMIFEFSGTVRIKRIERDEMVRYWRREGLSCHSP